MHHKPSHVPSQTIRPRLRRVTVLGAVLRRVLMIAMIYVLVNLLTVRYIVQGVSMEPTFSEGQFLLVSRLDYLFNRPSRFDVIVFHYPDNPAEDYIKRIIGLPYDVVEMRNTRVWINGELLIESYIPEACTPMMCPDSFWQLGPDEYFVMGDNRNLSQDSRFFGVVREEFLLGKVVLRYYPVNDIKWLAQSS